jgi:soluble lytic murein transglycosylase-like protein
MLLALILLFLPTGGQAAGSDRRSLLLSKYIEKNALPGVSPYERWEMARRIVIESDRAGIPLYLAVAIAQQESGFNPRALNRDSRDYGLYQIHFAFWKSYFARREPGGLKPLSKEDLLSIPVNVRVGLLILGHDYDLERGNLVRTIGLYCGRKGEERDIYVGHVLKNGFAFLSFMSRHRPGGNPPAYSVTRKR